MSEIDGIQKTAARVKRKPERSRVLQHTFAAARHNTAGSSWLESRLSESGFLQRQCACSNHTIDGGECPTCGPKSESSVLQRTAINAIPDDSSLSFQAKTHDFSKLGAAKDFSRVPAHSPTTQSTQIIQSNSPFASIARIQPASISAFPGVETHIGRTAGAVGSTATRNVNGAGSGDEMQTANRYSASAPDIFRIPVPLSNGGSTPARNCHVASGPTYSPTGAIPVTTSGGRKRAAFTFSSSFGSDASTGRVPAACQVRQYIKWNKAFQDWASGPPHSGFPSSSSHGNWYEDRDSSNKRYGHRSGTHSDPIAGCGDEYKTGTTQDQANGSTYCGRDGPNGPTALTGKWHFQLKVIDTANSNAVKASSSIISITW